MKMRVSWPKITMLLVIFIEAYFIVSWKETYYLCSSNQDSILKINSKQADIIESQNDTIKYLKFKLTTLKSNE